MDAPIVRDIGLILHMIGLAMGLGTSFAFMFLGISSSKMDKEEGIKFNMNTFALTKMGHIGLVLLVLSGGMLMTPYWNLLQYMPLMIAKLVLVLVLAAQIGIMSSKVKKARKGDAETHLKSIKSMGPIAMLTGLAIVVLAVLTFH